MKDIDLYYESIKEVYDQIAQWPSEKPSLRERFVEGWENVNMVLLLLSIIPIIPIIISSTLSYFRVSIWMMNFSSFTVGYFIATWVVVSLFFGAFSPIIKLIKPKKELKPKGPPQRLSPDQLTFLAVYEAYKELKIYFVSHIDHHIERCRKAISRAFPRAVHRIYGRKQFILDELEPTEFEMQRLGMYRINHRIGSPGLSDQISVAESFLRTFEKHEWLNLNSDIKTKIQALVEFPDKILFRLYKKEDLPSVLSVLESLARFTYAYLPEHQTYMEAPAIDALRNDGNTQMSKFVQEVNSMTSYALPEKQNDEKPATKQTLMQKFRASGYSEVLLRFSAWFVLILTLTSVTVYLASLKLTLNSDTMATLIIGTSVAGAAALCAVIPNRAKQD